MDILSDILFLVLSVLGIYLLIKILSAPIRWIFKLLLHAGLGYLALCSTGSAASSTFHCR